MIFQEMDKSIDQSKIRKPGRVLLLLSVFFALSSSFIDPSPPVKEKVTAVKAGKIQTVARGVIENGVILIRDDRIVEIGAQVAIPSNAEVIDFSDSFLMPGIVSPDSNLGVFKREKLGTEFFYRFPEPAGKNQAFYPVTYSIYPEHPDYSLALKNGFTTLAISPPPAGISGLGSIIRPEGETLEDIVVKDRAYLKISVYVNTPFWNMLKGSLEEGQRLQDEQKKKAEEKAKQKRETKKGEAKDKAKSDAKTEEATISESTKIFRDVVQGKIPVLAECAGPDAVSHLLELVAGYPGVKLIVKGGPEIYRVGQTLREKSIPVILEPVFEVRQGFLQPYSEITNFILKCQALDLRIAFQAPGNIEEQIHLLDYLNELSQHGVKKDVLFKGVTLLPAQLLGMDSLVGSLEKGKKADIIVLKNDPFDNIPAVEKIIFGGQVIQ
jgi:hypothetical protein